MSTPTCHPSAPAPVVDPTLGCEGCGTYGAVAFDGATLCPACYAERGSCCAGEFERSDAGEAPGSTQP